MSNYKELQALLKTLRFGETLEHIPSLLKQAESDVCQHSCRI